MINLLPPSQKEELKQRDNLIVSLNIGIAVLAFLISLLLLLTGVYFFLLGELKSQETILETKLRYLNLELEKEISAKNNFLSKILLFETKKREIFPILEEISQILPEGIKLESISISKVENEEIQILLTGFSQDRKRLISFREILQKRFSEVSFPTQVWLKEREINFSVSFKRK
jgi:Tfp pilus assembly protein PilN